MRSIVVSILSIYLLVSCSEQTNFSNNTDGVVITKNPKGGSGENSQTKQLQLFASWLAPTSNLLVEVSAIQTVDENGVREIVGSLDPATFVTVTALNPGKIQFQVESEILNRAKKLEVVSGKIILQKDGKNFGAFVSNTTFSFPIVESSNEPIKAEFSSAKKSSSGECAISGELSAKRATLAGVASCGGAMSDDSDNDDDDDDDDDDDNR